MGNFFNISQEKKDTLEMWKVEVVGLCHLERLRKTMKP
jgi:hypothetical protein